MVFVSEEPTTLHDALSNKNWKLAMDSEFAALFKNKAWLLVPPQQGKNVIDCKWMYKVKKADGSIILIGIRPILLLKASSSGMGLTMRTCSVL